MKISNSKKELARIISENGGWQEYCEWAVQDKSGEFGEKSVILFEGEDRPFIEAGKLEWTCSEGFESDSSFGRHVCNANKLIKNWHQCILSREEYFHLYPAPDADGWIECNGYEPGIDRDAEVEVKFRDGKICHGSNPVRAWCWIHGGEDDDIIAYRLRNPEQSNPEFCESVTRSIPEPESKPTIEQLAADYRNRKAYADRKQTEADAAKADAEAKLAVLIAAGKAIGLVVSVVDVDPELVITDWRDLKLGDIVWWSGDSRFSSGEYQVYDLEEYDHNGPCAILLDVGGCKQWIDHKDEEWRFIRRP